MLTMKIPREQKAVIIKNVQVYFEEERSENIGELGADLLVDFMMKELAPYIYNQAIEDARRLVVEKMSQIEDELFSWKSIKTKKEA